MQATTIKYLKLADAGVLGSMENAWRLRMEVVVGHQENGEIPMSHREEINRVVSGCA
jgi:hypothetical protein